MPRRTLAVLALALATAAGSSALAAPPSTAFTYQGELKENGQPVTASLPITFRLFNAPTNGQQLAEVTKANVQITNGRFAEPLSFPVTTMNGSQALWLEVVVNGNILPQRQQITGAAYSLATRGITVDAQNNVGIGTTTPSRKLSVAGGMDVYDSGNQGIYLSSNTVSFSDGNEDSFYRFNGLTQKHTWSTYGADCVTIDSGGRVGIGTMNPTAALEVTAPAGDASVKLPAKSIGPSELAASPGIAAIRNEFSVTINGVPGAATVIAARTITAPADGYLVVHGTGLLGLGSEGIYMHVTLNGVNQGPNDYFPPGGLSADRLSPAILRVIPVTAGTHTVQWTAATWSGSPTIQKPNFLVMYFPTAHGEVVP
jgi:hypothetical protein